MLSDFLKQTVDESFFRPLVGIIQLCNSSRVCREFSDDSFLRIGVQRVLEASQSGRGFLQEHGLRFDNTPGYSNYFASLRSERRCRLVGDVSRALLSVIEPQLNDRFQHIPELNTYECFAQDGHWHQAAVHDERHEGRKMAVGHFYSLNLRSHGLRHMATAEGLHENDMHALKRIKPKGLRHGVPKGKRVLIVYDKAGIDFDYWNRCRKETAVYFLSRVKSNMVFDYIDDKEWDQKDARNAGVTSDRRVMTHDNHLLRIVSYTDPRDGNCYEFLTNEMDLPPGIIVELYRRRWEAEKVFDEIKNKLQETKAWASSLEAKQAQAQLISITHNLLMAYERHLEQNHAVVNTAEDARRTKRAAKNQKICAAMGKVCSEFLILPRWASQLCVKFIRWVRQSIRDQLTEVAAVPRLRALYAVR